MARLGLPGSTPAERAQVLADAVQSALANVKTTNIISATNSSLTSTTQSSTDGVVGSVVSAVESLFCPSSTPTTIRGVLLGLLNQTVTIVTPFDSVTGTLIAVQRDYAVLVNAAGQTVLVPFANIESVTSP